MRYSKSQVDSVPVLTLHCSVHSLQDHSHYDLGLARKRSLWWEYSPPPQNHILRCGSEVKTVFFVLIFLFPQLPSTVLGILCKLSQFVPGSNFCEMHIVWLSLLSYEVSDAQRLINWLRTTWHWKRPWCWERWKAGGDRATEDEMVGWHHQLNGHEFEQTPGDSEGQESRACCRPWGCKESDMTYLLNSNLALSPNIVLCSVLWLSCGFYLFAFMF